MFESIGLWLKRNFKAAYKTVTLGIKQYIPFLLALLIIEALFFGSSMMFNNNYTNDEKKVMEEYDYHLALTGLSQAQALAIVEKDLTIATNLNQQLVYDAIGPAVEHNGTYDVYVYLNTDNKKFDFLDSLFKPDDLNANYWYFIEMFGGFFTDGNPAAGANDDDTPEISDNTDKDLSKTAAISKSPLYLLEERKESNTDLHRLADLILVVVSVFVLTSLFSVRTNHQKFLYGIYASFGAHSRRLRISAMWELAVCGLLTLIPAFILALAVSLGVYLPEGISFSINIFKLLAVIPIMLIIIMISVYLPMKIISLKEPMTLIVSDDNSNLISSPRFSLKGFIKSKFPSTYEWISAWRFRSYNIKLALISSVFCIIFISGIYLADLYETDRQVNFDVSEEYVVTFDDMDVVDDDTLSMFEIYGVTGIHKSFDTKKASDLSQHVLIHKSNVGAFSGLIKYPNDTPGYPANKDYMVMNDINYQCAVDRDMLSVIEETYQYEGDLDSIFEKENHIIIGNSYNNRQIFDYKVGDTIRLGVITRMVAESGNYSGNALLAKQLKNNYYEYIDYTIGAIITDYPSALQGMPLVLAKDDYEYVTATYDYETKSKIPTPAQANSLNIKIDYTLSGDELDELDRELRDMAAIWGGKLYRTGTTFDQLLESRHMYEKYLIILSSVLLIFIPIVWFFNQMLFYSKRANEFYILQSISAPMSKIRSLHLQSGIIMIPLSIISLIAATLTILVIYCLTTFILPVFFSLGSRVLVGFSIPPLAYVISFVLTFACSMLSAYLPYLKYKKSQELDISIEYDD